LWYISGDRRLSDSLRESIQSVDNTVYLSVVSLWEVIIKHQLGKLPLPQPPQEYLPAQRIRHQIESLSLNEASVALLSDLPLHHRDPFDRMLICQALSYDLMLATVDNQIEAYDVPVIK